MPTVAELVRWTGPLVLQIMDGHAGLAREVSRVVWPATGRRDVSLQTGDIVLVSLAEWQSSGRPDSWQLVDAIGRLPVAAVLVFADGAETWWPSESCATPVILALDCRIEDAEAMLNGWLAQCQAREARQLNQLRGELLDGYDASDSQVLAERIAELTSKTVLLHTPASVVAVGRPSNDTSPRQREVETALFAARTALASHLHQRNPAIGPMYDELPLSGLAMLAVPIYGSARDQKSDAYLAIVARPSEFTHRDRLIASFAFDALLQPAAQQLGDIDHPPTQAGECSPEVVRLLLRGEIERACVEAEHVGFDLNGPCFGAAVRASETDHVSEKLCTQVARVFGEQQALISIEDDCVLCLVSSAGRASNQWQRHDTLARWHAELSADVADICVGYSAQHAGPRAARQALGEARQALRMSLRQGSSRGVHGYAATWLRELVVSDHALELVQRLYDALLRPLVFYDQSHNHDLVRTLDCHLNTGSRTLRTAELLGVHRNSVLYRLQRVTELTGADLDDADTRVLLQTLLRVGVQELL